MPDSVGIARSPSPLTEGKLERMPGYSRRRPPVGSEDNKDGQFTYSNLHNLESTEHNALASRSNKVKMINMVADSINNFPADKPTTFISVGSGHLMSEELIHRQLSEEKKNNVHWRCIDPIYLQHGTSQGRFFKGKDARIQFGKGKNARAFSSSQAYLSKQENGQLVSSEDKSADVVIFVNDPPSILPGDYGKITPSLRQNGFLMRGNPMEESDIKKANSILLTLAPNEQKYVEQLSGLSENLSQGVAFGSSTIKCFPKSDGTYEYVSGGDISERLPERVRQQVSYASERLPNDKAPIEKLNTGIDLAIQGIIKASSNSIMAVKTIFSDFDRSVEELIEHFSDASGSVILAKLENNEAEITTVKAQ